MNKAQAKRIIERFERAHERAFPKRGESSYTIPFKIMRDYEDVKRLRGPGLHNVTITVTKKPVLGILNWDVMLANNVGIRVEGEKWT